MLYASQIDSQIDWQIDWLSRPQNDLQKNLRIDDRIEPKSDLKTGSREPWPSRFVDGVRVRNCQAVSCHSPERGLFVLRNRYLA